MKMYEKLEELLKQEIESLESMPWLTPLLSRQLNAFHAALTAIQEGHHAD